MIGAPAHGRLEQMIAAIRVASVRLALVCALVLAAFAHTPGASQAAFDADYAAQYTLPDGSLPVLCLTGTGDDGTDRATACDFCRIADTAAVFAPHDRVACPADNGSLSAGVAIKPAPLEQSRPKRWDGPVRAPPLRA